MYTAISCTISWYNMRCFFVLCLALSLTAADRQKAPVSVKHGLKVPGVQIPYQKLKSEAELQLPGLQPGAVFAESVWVARKEGIVAIDPKTNKAADPIPGLKQA